MKYYYIKKVVDTLTNIKQNLPDLLNLSEANPVLFKINKYNELFNPLDECLQVEMNTFNDFLTKLDEDINSLLGILKGDMIFVEKYYNMVQSINQNLVPKDWLLSKYTINKKENIISWQKKVKDKYNFFNTWILEGSMRVYDLSYLSNDRLFITLLPLYFQKKLPEGKASSDKIKLHFKLTKYDSNTDVTDEIFEEYKKNNFIDNFIFIKGLKLKGFEMIKEEDKDIKFLKENENTKNDLLPIIVVTYNIEEYQSEEIIQTEQNNDESEEEEDEDEEEIKEEEEKKEEKEEKKEEKEGQNVDNKENIENKKEESVEIKENKEESRKETSQQKDEINIKESENIENKENVEKTKSEREIIMEKDNTKVNQRITVEETRIKTKKADFMDNIKNNKSMISSHATDGIEKSVRIKTKTKYYKKHCRLEIPFCEEQVPGSYNINEPYGYIEIRFDCEKDKQEEYFRNKKLKIELNK